jgi:hypothetical protein
MLFYVFHQLIVVVVVVVTVTLPLFAPLGTTSYLVTVLNEKVRNET